MMWGMNGLGYCYVTDQDTYVCDGDGGGTPTSTPSSSGVNWNAIVNQVSAIGATIIKSQFPAGAGYPPGTVAIRTASGEQMIRYPEGQMIPAISGTLNPSIGTGNILPMVMIGGLAFFMIIALARR